LAEPGTGWEPLLRFGQTTIAEKVLWGSGAFLLQRPVADLVAEFRALPVRPAVMERWLGGNAERVLARPWSWPERSRAGPAGGEPPERRLLVPGGRDVAALVDGRAEPTFELGIERAGMLAGDGRDLGRQQVEEDAVLVRRPHRAVAPEERRAGALLAAEPERPVEEAVDEPLEADRHLEEPPAEVGGDPVDHRARDQRLADR